jgi:hypothetical protein
MSKKQEVPDGWRLDAAGRMVEVDKIKQVDLERDELVVAIAAKAKAMNGQMAELKSEMFGDIANFVARSAKEYKTKIGGQKGNVSLVSFDGKYKVLRAFQETLVFDERLQAAKAMIDNCLQRWSEGARPEIKMLINDAFQVDQAGNINTNRVLTLRRLQFDDKEWKRAMQAISDALQVAGSKSYVRVYERDEAGRYQPIPLDFATA